MHIGWHPKMCAKLDGICEGLWKLQTPITKNSWLRNQSSFSLHMEASFCQVRPERPIIISLPMCMIPTATIQGKPSITALPGCPLLPNTPHNAESLTTRELEVYFSESFIILIFKKSQILIKQGNWKQTFRSPSTSWNLNSDFALLLAQIMWSFFSLY